jgi:hypothetical protein
MEVSPRRTWLYRRRLCAVIFAGVLAGSIAFVCLSTEAVSLHAQLVQQYGRKQTEKGPRALGLVQISDKGKARLIPIVIMLDGKFYDAGSYHATPVPMALDFGIVYEGFRTGVSQGIFTITQPGELNHNWIAEGTWVPAGEKAAEKTKKYAPPVIDDSSDKDDHPVLHRRSGGEADKDDSKPAKDSKDASSTSASPASPGSDSKPSQPSAPSQSSSSPAASTSGSAPNDSKPDTAKNATKPSTSTPAKTSASTSRTSDLDQPISDPNRPILRRGKPDPNAHHEPFVNFDNPDEVAKAATDASKEAAATAPSVQTVAAISDAGGPDARAYTYDLKPAEEAIFRNKMLELAAQQFRPKSQPAPQPASGAKKSTASSSTSKTAASARKASGAKTAQPLFEDLKLRIFDLSSSNEPVLVMSARTPIPPAGTRGSQVPQEITLIARTNLEGELQKLFYAQTDSRHLDVSPRMELIDAVDADGDGRGELLFRRTSDAGSAYAIYRITADGLWPLFEGKP